MKHSLIAACALMVAMAASGAVEFNGSNQGLRNNSHGDLNEPFSMSAFAKHDNFTAYQRVVSLTTTGATGKEHAINSPQTTGECSALSFQTSTVQAKSSVAKTANQWEVCSTSHSATNSRAAYLDGGSKGTNTSTQDVEALSRLGIGYKNDGTPDGYTNGSVAFVALWDGVALSDDDHATLGLGFSPLLVQPTYIIRYFPLLDGDYTDKIGGMSLTAVNSPTEDRDNPRVFLPY